jgi:hypothetical protein
MNNRNQSTTLQMLLNTQGFSSQKLHTDDITQLEKCFRQNIPYDTTGLYETTFKFHYYTAADTKWMPHSQHGMSGSENK